MMVVFHLRMRCICYFFYFVYISLYFADTCIIPLVDLKDIPTRVFNHRMDL